MAKASKPKTDAAEAAQDQKPVLPLETFSVEEVKYRFKVPKFHIPGIGVRTAYEALLDKDPYEALEGKTICEYLVSVKSQIVEED